MNATIQDTLEGWHKRLGHASVGVLKKMANKATADGFKIIKSKNKFLECEVCNRAKMHRTQKSKKRKRPQWKEDLVVAADTFGPANWSRKGHKYVLFISNRGWVKPYFLNKKSDAYGKIKEYFKEVDREHGSNFVTTFRGDNKFDINTLRKYFEQNGIQKEFTVPYNSFQNGRAERFHRTVMDMARAMLIEAKLSSSFWEHAVRYAVYIRNRLSSRSDEKQRSGYERKYGEKPDLSKVHIFGQTCFHRPPNIKWKIKDRGNKVRFLTVEEEREGYILWDPAARKIIYSRDVKFPKDSKSSEETEADITTDNAEGEEVVSTQPTEPRRSKRLKTKSKRKINEVNLVLHEEAREPIKYFEVRFSTDSAKWTEAMIKETTALTNNGTWRRVKRPTGANVISCKWVYKLKKGDEGQLTVYKARLVARGFIQEYMRDYTNTYSPVAGKSSLRTFLIFARKFKLRIDQYDVPSAYVKASLQGEVIYIELPEGFRGGKNDIGNLRTSNDDPGTGDDPTEVLRLEKGLYGLKQSGMYWYKEISERLISLGLIQLKSDKCLFYRFEGEKIIMVLLYVDDILIASNWSDEKTKLVSDLKIAYQIKELGKVNNFLGMKITQHKDGQIFISQESFVEAIVSRFDLEQAPKRSTPLDRNERFEENDEDVVTGIPYRALLGTLLYLSTCSRPDIAFAVNQAARFCERPTLQHWEQLKKIAAYAKCTKDYGLFFDPNTESDKVARIEVFTDADWANCKDTRKSISGGVIMLWGYPIIWSSKKQTIVATSTCLAEIVAACSGLIEADKAKELIQELKFISEIDSTLYLDNRPAINLLQNEKPPQTMKHLSIKYHATREKIQDGSYKIEHCPTKEMVADIFTKSLDHKTFANLRKKLHVVPMKYAF